MAGEFTAVRSHPAVIVSVVIAAIALTACALVAIAWMLGWVPSQAGPAPGSMAAPGQQVTGTAPGVALLPGETLVDNPEGTKAAPDFPVLASKPPASAIPPPAPPPPSRPAPATGPQPSTPSFARSLPQRAAPSAPTYLREEPMQPPRSYERSIRGVCVNCGTVTSISSAGADWDVRVRFEDGSSQTIRYPERPPLRAGERVHLEDGRLLPD